jgi:hypothetical protein
MASRCFAKSSSTLDSSSGKSDLAQIALDHAGPAAAFARGVAVEAALARILSLATMLRASPWRCLHVSAAARSSGHDPTHVS